MEGRLPDDTQAFVPRKLTHEQARMEHLLYWSRKTVAERLAASAALTRRLYKLRGIDWGKEKSLDERNADLTPRRVSRRPR